MPNPSDLTLAANGGVESVTLNSNQIPSHTHSGTTSAQGAHTHSGTTGTESVGLFPNYKTATSKSSTHTAGTGLRSRVSMRIEAKPARARMSAISRAMRSASARVGLRWRGI